MAASDDKKLSYIQERVDAISDKVSEIDSTLSVHVSKFDAQLDIVQELRNDIKATNRVLSKNTDSLDTHIYRTNLLEEYMKKIDARFHPMEIEHLRQVAVQEWLSAKLKLLAKIGAAVGALGSLGLAIKFLAHFFL